MIVMKFGGTSVESAAAIERVAGIVQARVSRRPLVVVSAMGKTTNALLEIARTAVEGDRDAALFRLRQVRDFHLQHSEMERTIEAHFQQLAELVRGLAALGELTPRSLDAVASFGERLSSLIVTRHFQRLGIPAKHMDARTVIVTDGRHTQAAPLFGPTNERLKSCIAPHLEKNVMVMGGFIGSTENGVTTTLGRGGSDFTAAIAGAGLDAEEIQIWTDVDGMLTCDPTICSGGHRVRRLSFREAAELAYFGAKVLHPATVAPAMEQDIPVRILNSRRPEVDGTLIVSHPVPAKNVIKAIATKRNITVLNVQSLRMFMAYGFLERMFDVFARHETPVDMISTSEVSVSLTIDSATHLEKVVADLNQFAEVAVTREAAIVCLVGEGIQGQGGIVARVFSALGGIEVLMLSQGASALNLGFVVAERDLEQAVGRLHQEFFRELDREVFDA
ncbi:MAG: lysine-sensitive aspartokinase 3 [Acidobacteria bacterium]|nr:lysine-sensitive aspartokinase 3 [Acidobacteriota bacterium]